MAMNSSSSGDTVTSPDVERQQGNYHKCPTSKESLKGKSLGVSYDTDGDHSYTQKENSELAIPNFFH